jgi:hypothetical protein
MQSPKPELIQGGTMTFAMENQDAFVFDKIQPAIGVHPGSQAGDSRCIIKMEQ